MNSSSRFVVDANVFIQAANGYYAFDICPGFWTVLLRQHKTGRVASIDKIKKELTVNRQKGQERDKLSEWANNDVPDTFFKKTSDQAVVKTFGELVRWVNSVGQFSTQAIAKFFGGADGWLIAYAKVNGLTLVTHETLVDPKAKRKVCIPRICHNFGVKYCDTFEMLRDVEAVFKSPRASKS